MLRAIDISNWQKGFEIRNNGEFSLVIVKATQGTSYTSETLDEQARACMKCGIPLGLYHFADGGEWKSEADHFIAAAKAYLPYACFIALDWESYAVQKGVSWAEKWLEYVAKKTGIAPHIYMSASVTNAYDWSSVADKFPLWVAAYQSAKPIKTGAWSECSMWQYSSSYHVSYDTRNLDASKIYDEGIIDMNLNDKLSDNAHSVRYVLDRFTDMGSSKLGERLTAIEKDLAEIKALVEKISK